jgi:uncharacterized RDD family membrane protein YckC
MTPETQTNYCSECGQPASPEELARFGDRLICPNCKIAYAQKLREGVAPAGFVRFGGFWLRVVATLIDGIIMAIPMGILQAVLFASLGLSLARMAPDPNAAPEEVFRMLAPMFGMVGLSWLVSIVVGCSYETFFIVQFAATPGKMALGLKVVRPDGTKLGISRAIGRYFAKLLSGMILGIGYIIAGFDSQKRGLHDMMCDTRVIKTRG